jgi:hypothetical protein
MHFLFGNDLVVEFHGFLFINNVSYLVGHQTGLDLRRSLWLEFSSELSTSDEHVSYLKADFTSDVQICLKS